MRCGVEVDQDQAYHLQRRNLTMMSSGRSFSWLTPTISIRFAFDLSSWTFYNNLMANARVYVFPITKRAKTYCVAVLAFGHYRGPIQIERQSYGKHAWMQYCSCRHNTHMDCHIPFCTQTTFSFRSSIRYSHWECHRTTSYRQGNAGDWIQWCARPSQAMEATRVWTNLGAEHSIQLLYIIA